MNTTLKICDPFEYEKLPSADKMIREEQKMQVHVVRLSSIEAIKFDLSAL